MVPPSRAAATVRNYEKEVVSWAAETKLFLNTQTTILSLKSEAEKLGLPEEDFNQSIENLKRAEYFSHSDLERWYYYFIRQDQENLDILGLRWNSLAT